MGVYIYFVTILLGLVVLYNLLSLFTYVDFILNCLCIYNFFFLFSFLFCFLNEWNKEKLLLLYIPIDFLILKQIYEILLQELSRSWKLGFSKPNIFATQCHRSELLQTMNLIRAIILVWNIKGLHHHVANI